MQNNYLFIDTETANDNQDICQIGAVIVTNGKIEKDLCLYVKPIEGFQKTYSDRHTITEEDVKDAEPFSKIWQKHFSQYIDNKYVIVAHNASFDLTAIRKTLQHYKIDLPALDYICTQAIAKEKELSGAREDLCKLFGLCIKKATKPFPTFTIVIIFLLRCVKNIVYVQNNI